MYVNLTNNKSLNETGATISVLTSRNLRLTKIWRKDGTIEGYGKAKWFTLKEEHVSDIEELSDLLFKLENRTDTAIIRGQHVGFNQSLDIPEDDEGVKNRADGYVRRTLSYFKDCKQHHLLIEVDDFKPPFFDPVENAAEAIQEYIVGCLPPQFHDVAYHWQLSSSAGHPSKQGFLKVHLWFWLKEPATSGALRAWARSIGLMCDQTVFNPVQLHYTAAPIIEKGAPAAFNFLRSCYHANPNKALDLTIDLAPFEGQLVESRRDLSAEDEDTPDPRYDWLEKNWTVLRKRNDGDLDVRCPFDFTHDGGRGEKAQKPGDSSTIYFRAGTNGYKRGHWKCQHDSCFGKSDEDYDRQVGYDPCGFEDETESQAVTSSSGQITQNPRNLDAWLNPDITLYRCEDIAPPEFNPASLPDSWAKWCEATAKSKACPVDFVALNLLVFASAWLGNARRIAPTEDWIEPPHLWGAVVTPPSGGKSPSQTPFTEVSKTLEQEEEPQWQFLMAEHEKKKAYAAERRSIWDAAVAKAAKECLSAPDFPQDAVEPEAPARPRVILCEATTQETMNLLARNPKGLAVFRDELSGWLGSFDRYSGAGADRGFYLESWNGGRQTVDLVKNNGKPVVVPYASLSIVGGLQPDKLREALAGADDGLPARFCYVWPKLVPYAPLMRENPQTSEARRQFLLTVARRLRSLLMDIDAKGNPLPRIVPLSQDALALFEGIRKEAIEKARTTRGLAAGWHGKTPARALRLALVIEFLTWAASPDAPEPQTVSATAMTHAGMYLGYMGTMFDRVIGGLAMDEAEANAASIMRLIVRDRPAKINERELYQRAGHAHLRKNDQRNAAFKVLEREGWIRRPPDNGKGRKRGDWEVNQKLWEILS